MERSKPEPDNVPNCSSHGADEQPTNADVSLGEDYGWLRSVVENSSEIVTVVDPDGTLRYASPAFGRVLGYDLGEAVGKMNVLDLVHPEDLPHVLEETEEALSKGGIVTNKAEYRFRHRDGSWRWMESVGTYLLDDPHVGGVVVASRDVTERKEAEEALRSSEAEVFGILESITDAFFSLDREWRFAYVNHQAEVVLNRSREDLVGERIWEDQTFYPQYRRAVMEGSTVMFEAYCPPFETWLSVRAYPSESGLSVYFQDVTERKQAEERIRFQAQLLGAVGEAVIAIDMEARGLYWNRAAEVMYGWSSEEVMGRHIREIIVPNSHRGRAEDIGAQVREGRNWTGQFVVQRKDGTTFPVEATNTPVFNEDGDFVGAIGVFRDITDRKRAEEVLRESEQRFGSAFRDAAIGMALVGTDGRFLQVNRSLCKILGYSEEELLAKTFQEITYPDDLESDVEQVRRMLSGEIETYQMEKRYLHKEGHVVWILLSVSLVYDEEGEPLYFISQIQDITERKRAEEALRKSEWRMAEAERLAHVGSWEWDVRSNTLSWSDELYRIFALSKDVDITYEGFIEGIHPVDQEFVRGVIQAVCENHVPRAFSHRIVWPDGTVRWLQCEAIVTVDEAGYLASLHGMTQDITELRQAEERLQYQAHHDLLTNLPNRQLFLDRLEQALRRTGRRPGSDAAVLFVDLDNFKVVNDSLGHEAGDLLLVRVGERLRRCLRPEDTLSRFGGDEFAMLLENVRSPRDAVRVAERIAEELSSPFMLEGRELVLRASLGIALGHDRTKGPGELLKEADTAMYRAKADGTGYRIFQPSMYEEALRRLKVENDMRRAVGAREFVVNYQPIVDLRSGQVWGTEALVRWEHPERGLLEPSQFVPLAEETGLVVPIGERVLEEACHWASKWQWERSEASPLVVCVNLSARQLRRQDLAETVEGVLRRTGLEGRYLSLDITETLYITVLEGNTETLEDLRRMGVHISVDDFGMGYSSLSYLKRLPVDTLKVDRSFVAGLGEDPEDTAIVRMIIELAHTLGMRIIAEGVESEEQAQQLRQMGCDLGQGFLFAEPLPPEAASEFLTR